MRARTGVGPAVDHDGPEALAFPNGPVVAAARVGKKMFSRQLAWAGLFAFATLTPPGSLAEAAAAAADAMTYCKSDVVRLCPGVEPGGGRIVGCLKAHKMEVSVGCAKALQKMKAQMGK